MERMSQLTEEQVQDSVELWEAHKCLFRRTRTEMKIRVQAVSSFFFYILFSF